MLLAREKTLIEYLLRRKLLLSGQMRIILLLYHHLIDVLGRVLMFWNVGMRSVTIVTLN